MNEVILVTGAGGFIGSHLVEALLKQGRFVRALVHYNSRSYWGGLDHLREDTPSHLEVILGDVADATFADKAVNGCSTVLHLAALIGIPYSYAAPESYVSVNVRGTMNLLVASQRHGVSQFIHTSTSEVYGSATYVPIDEHHPLQAQSPYAATKIAADKLAESWYRSFDLPVLTVRPFNTYGPRQSLRAVIPSIIAQALKSNVIRVGALHPIRDMTFVDDTVNGYLMALGRQELSGEVINLGTGTGKTIGEIVAMVADILGIQTNIVTEAGRQRPDKSEVQKLVSNNSKALAMIDWSPKMELVDGLRRTIGWMIENQNIMTAERYAI